MTELTIAPLRDETPVREVCLVARYPSGWLYRLGASHWELPAAELQPGETPAAAVARLLAEAGGGTAPCLPLRDYGTDGTLSGRLYTSEQTDGCSLPDGFVCSDLVPLSFRSSERFPLFDTVQDVRNLRTNPGELWDVYDAAWRRTGRSHRRGEPMQPGDYHLTVHVWLMNPQGEFLLTRRTPNKGYPLLWEVTGGSALQGDDSRSAALREMREETGLALEPDNGICLFHRMGPNFLNDVWLFRQAFDLSEVHLLPGETCEARLADRSALRALIDAGAFAPCRYLDRLFHALDRLT